MLQEPHIVGPTVAPTITSKPYRSLPPKAASSLFMAPPPRPGIKGLTAAAEGSFAAHRSLAQLSDLFLVLGLGKSEVVYSVTKPRVRTYQKYHTL